MSRAAQALADALAGNVRLRFSDEKWTSSHVRNMLAKAGVPVIWERGPIRVNYGRLTINDDRTTFEYEVLWEPEVRVHAVARARGLVIESKGDSLCRGA